MKLNDNKIKAMKATDKSQKFADGGGLQLLVHANGSKYFQFRYFFEKKDKLLSFGTYPEVSLLEARRRAFQCREQLQCDPPVDPQARKQEAKSLSLEVKANTFEVWAFKWFDHWKHSVSKPHADYTKRRLDIDINPFIGGKAIASLDIDDIKDTFNKCVDRGALDMASRIYQIIKSILQFAVEHKKQSHCTHNVALDIKLSANIPHRDRKNYARLSSADFPELLRKIEAYQGDSKTRIALKIMPLVFVRTRELIEAKWVEIEWDNKLWRIPKERMKSGSEHLVPLAEQSIELLKTLWIVSGHCEFLFPSRFGTHKCMSNNTLLKALATMGYQYEMTGHGFRGMARTELAELGYAKDWMEIQLAHLVGDETERAYNKAQFLHQRACMMQDWANHLDKLRRGAVVLPFQAAS